MKSISVPCAVCDHMSTVMPWGPSWSKIEKRIADGLFVCSTFCENRLKERLKAKPAETIRVKCKKCGDEIYVPPSYESTRHSAFGFICFCCLKVGAVGYRFDDFEPRIDEAMQCWKTPASFVAFLQDRLKEESDFVRPVRF